MEAGCEKVFVLPFFISYDRELYCHLAAAIVGFRELAFRSYLPRARCDGLQSFIEGSASRQHRLIADLRR